MRITVRVTPNVKTPRVEKVDTETYHAFVDAPAKENKANIRLIGILAEYFGVPKSKIGFVSGIRSRVKVLAINE